jgi:hypothetical protein
VQRPEILDELVAQAALEEGGTERRGADRSELFACGRLQDVPSPRLFAALAAMMHLRT